MRRLDGVDHITLDTVEQFATIYWGEPAEIDFEEVLDAAESAAFEFSTMTLTARGSTVAGACADCERPHGILQVDKTNQRLSLNGASGPDSTVRPFVADVSNWDSEEPMLKLRDEEANFGQTPLTQPTD